MKRTLSLLTAAILFFATHAHEGMWLLNKLKQVNEAEMQKLGFKLTAEDIYDINKSSLKDGIVRLGGGFCSGEMVSAEGLFLTNHHCGYDAVQRLEQRGARLPHRWFLGHDPRRRGTSRWLQRELPATHR